MAKVSPVANQFRGINAHLHSLWQAEGGWDEFHTAHMTDLMGLMRRQLAPMGYFAAMEQSLQIRRADNVSSFPRSDVSIYDMETARPQQAVISSLSLKTPLLELMEIEEESLTYRALQIYTYIPEQNALGEPVAWIELLSPSNKPGGQDAKYYREKRLKLLKSGLVFVELDYLHESSPAFTKLPDYRTRGNRDVAESASHPYWIIVADPRPSLEDGMGEPYGFDVDEPIPEVEIPLNAGDMFQFDFNHAYQATVENYLYTQFKVDYRSLPVNFDRYSPADQARIVSRMLNVLDRAKRGETLEQPPQPVETIPLEEGLQRLEQLQAEMESK